MKPTRLIPISLAIALFSLPLWTAAQTSEEVALPTMSELREGGRPAMRSWIHQRSTKSRMGEPSAIREFRASVELAVIIYNGSGGELIEDAVEEAEDRILVAQSAVTDSTRLSRLAAILGSLYERTKGDRANARRWYETALRHNPDDKVAKRGIQSLDMARAVAVRKDREADRARELERAMGRMAGDSFGPVTVQEPAKEN